MLGGAVDKMRGDSEPTCTLIARLSRAAQSGPGEDPCDGTNPGRTPAERCRRQARRGSGDFSAAGLAVSLFGAVVLLAVFNVVRRGSAP